MALPLRSVLVINGPDLDADIASVDPEIQRLLENKANLFSLEQVRSPDWKGEITGILVLCHAHTDGPLLDSLGGTVQIVSNYGVGTDHVDLDACRERNVKVGNTPGVLTEATADMGWALLMAAARRIPQADTFARGEEFATYKNMALLGRAVHGATIGIIGMGRIGQAVAKRATGFDMTILYHNRSQNKAGEDATGAVRVDLDELLERSDYIVLVCPLTPQTTNMIDAKAFKKMKNTAILINIARGPVINTVDLVDALKSGEIEFAGIDVFDPEPLPRDHPLNSLTNVVLTPHRGSATKEARQGMAELCVQNLLAGLNGEKLPAQLV
eukprot:m.33516 g.33516  ORF g.33516 m.33516 type:complete len:327 (-) comp16831_c0_seq1:85-1065(-)